MAVLGLSACAGIGTKAPEEGVKERAQARWDALVKDDFKAAYEYLSPGSRVVVTEEKYVASLRQGFWKSAHVEKVTCSTPTTCEADISIDYEFRGLRTRTPLRETWIKEGSNWWYVQR